MNNPSPQNPKSLTRKVLIIFAGIITFETVFLLVLLGLLEDSKQRLAEERYARAVVAAISNITATMHSGSKAVIGQTLLAQTEQKHKVLDEYRAIFRRMPRDQKALNTLLAAEPERQDRLKELNDTIDEVLDLADKITASSLDRETPDKKNLHLHYSVQISDKGRSVATQLDDLEKIYRDIEMANKQSVASQSDLLLNASLLLGFLVNVGIAISLYQFFVRGITNRLKIVADNTVNLIVGKPLLARVKGDDEVAHLDLTFREMASNLEDIRTKEAVILDHATNFICSLTTKGVFVSVPAASSAMWGYSQEELIGRRLSSIVKPEQYELTRKRLESLTQSGMSTSFENSVRCRDGTMVELAWTANLNKDGTVVCIARNITERSRINNLIKTSEKRFSSIVAQLPVAIASCDRSFVIESVNPATSKLFLYQPHELLGKRIDVLFYGTSGGHQRIEMSEDLKQLMELATREATHLNVRRRDETQLPVELNLSSYEAPQGRRNLACFTDISRRVELELAKRDFVSMIGHDLRSPLMSLLGTLGMMASETRSNTESDTATISDTASDTADDTASTPAQCISDAKTFADAETLVEQLVGLIGDFLDLGKMEAGFDSLYITESSLTEILKEAAGSMTASNVQIECSLFDAPKSAEFDSKEKTQATFLAEQPIRADRDRLTLTIAHLIDVLAFFNKNERKISLSLEETNDLAIIRIAGSKCTLPQVVKDTCVEGYALVEIDNEGKSSGLRLAVTRAITQAHGGSLAVVEKDDNAMFEIKIPMLHLSKSDSQPAEIA